ncbi:MAG: transglycosylase SLT domain-containing protein [Candidatus Dactylopiibacterium sp.]|nr:transglycosylase SLT domain-containing protein [Candidatus Dactylopiibacterium sp.]
MKFGLCALLLAWSSLSVTAHADPGDERILAARDAASRADIARLASLAATPGPHVLEPYVQYWLLSARIARPTEIIDPATVDAFLREHAGSQLAERLRGEWLRRLGNEKRWPEFVAAYGLLQQPDIATQCYAIQSDSQWAPEARAALSAQWLTLLDVPASCEPALAALVVEGRQRSEDVWQRFRRLVETKRFTSARNTVAWLPADEAPALASLNAMLDNPARFIAMSRPTGKRADRELILGAVARLARADSRNAAERWRAVENADFRREERAYAWGQIAWVAAQSRLVEASAWYKLAEGASMAPDQYAWRVRASLRRSDWAGVREAILGLPEAQRDAPEWTYWLGRALQAQGRGEEAREQFRRHADQPSFYGILSTEALGRTYEWPAAATPASAEELTRVRQLPDLRRAEALYRLGFNTEGAREWNWGLRGAPDRTLLAAAEHARQLGFYDRAINTAERTRGEHDFALRYLAPYYDSFSQNANQLRLDLAWVYGLVRQESRFLSVARSGVGAQGLMQVMPATGKWIAGKQGWSDYRPEWLTGIDTNIRVGSAYLRYVLDLFDGQRVMAAAAYNAGPGRARAWRDTQPLEGAIYAETIPFTETRDYVKKVMANAELYAVLFERRPVSLGSRLGQVPASPTTAAALAPETP